MKNVEDIYPATPMQKVMLLHAMSASGYDSLHSQFCYRLQGPLQSPLFEAAWQHAVARHASLRTAFLWDSLQSPMQVVRKSVDLPCETFDWRGRSKEEVSSRLEEFLAADRERGFDPAKAPLMRLAIARVGDESYEFVWSSHHLILDRWCTALVLGDVVFAYEALRRGETPAWPSPAGRFRDYVAWLQNQNVSATKDFWRESISGIERANRRVTSGTLGPSRATRAFSREQTQRLREMAKKAKVTLSLLFQAAWALWMNAEKKSLEVVYGLTVSGRPPNLFGVEGIVGSFVSNVPVHLKLSPDETLGSWLRTLRETQQERVSHEYLSAADIRLLSDLPSSEPLFECLFVWLSEVEKTQPQEIEIRPRSGRVETTWPVTFTVTEKEGGLNCEIDANKGLDASIILDRVVTLLNDLWERIDQPIKSIPGFWHQEGDAAAPDQALENSFRRITRSTPQSNKGARRGRELEERSMVEQMLRHECAQVLGHQDFDLSQNFFDIGGDSLSAAQLHEQLENVMGRVIPMLSLFQARSLDEMIDRLLKEDWPMRSEMVRAARSRGSKTPLFCLSSPEVNSIGYVLMSRHMDEDQPVYLVQHPPDSETIRRMAVTEIHQTALEYLDAIREVQPKGPYRLAGMCDGALLAYEAARQLNQEGEEVEFLGMLNTFSLHTLSKLNHLRRAEVRVRYYFSRVLELRRLGWKAMGREISKVWARKFRSKSLQPQIGGGASSSEGMCGGPGKRPPDPVDSEFLKKIHDEWQQLDWPHLAPKRSKYLGR